MKYIFFLDIDGTLTWGNKIPRKTAEAIEYARSNGHPVYINTGRSLAFIPAFVLTELSFDGIVAGLGAYCSVGNTVIRALEIPKDSVKEVFTYLEGRGRRFIFEGENDVLVYKRTSSFSPITHAEQIDGIYSNVKTEKIYIEGVLDPDELDFFNRRFFTLQHANYAECAILGCNKAVGMDIITSFLSERYTTVAMGDSVNDLQMLSHADISVAMGNAPENVKKLCTFVSSSAEEGGVGDAIYKILHKE